MMALSSPETKYKIPHPQSSADVTVDPNLVSMQGTRSRRLAIVGFSVVLLLVVAAILVGVLLSKASANDDKGNGKLSIIFSINASKT